MCQSNCVKNQNFIMYSGKWRQTGELDVELYTFVGSAYVFLVHLLRKLVPGVNIKLKKTHARKDVIEQKLCLKVEDSKEIYEL